jgi:transitional endoplasmic reticulum ATPase
VERVDSAALRGGRFTEKLVFALPDRGVVAKYITTWLKQRQLDLVAPLTIEDLAQELEGAAIADVQAVLQEAVNGLVSRQLTGQETAGLSIGEFQRAMISILGGEGSL